MRTDKRNKILSAVCVAVMALSSTGGMSVSAESSLPNNKIEINFTDINGKVIEGKDGTTRLKVTDSKGHQAKVKKVKDFDYIITDSKELTLKPGETYTISQTEDDDYVPMKLSITLPDDSEGYPDGYWNMSFKIRKFRWGDVDLDGDVNFNDSSAIKNARSGRGKYTFTFSKTYGQTATVQTFSGRQAFSSQNFYECAFFDKIKDDSIEISWYTKKQTNEQSGTGISGCKYFTQPLTFQAAGMKLKSNPADVDRDNKLTANDLTLIQKYVAGQNVQLGH